MDEFDDKLNFCDYSEDHLEPDSYLLGEIATFNDAISCFFDEDD